MTKFLKNADVTGYISQTSVTSSLVKTDANGKIVAATAGTDYQAPTTALLPIGGTAGQILSKIDATNYNTQWIDNFAAQLKHEVKLGATLAKGKAVYVSSADGTNMIVSAASNASEATSSKTLGLLETGGVTNDKVKVITEGLLAGLDTSTATAGDPVWLGTGGDLLFGLANKPVAPAHMVFIGIVTRVQSNNGEIFVKVQNGFELNEIHDVSISSLANNHTLVWESATSLWKNKTIAAALGFTPADDSAVVKLTGDQTVAGIKTFTSVLKVPSLSLNGGVLDGNNIVSMRANPTGGQFRIEKSDGSLSAYPFYIGVDGTALAYYYNAAGALKVLLHTNGTSYFGNSLSVGYSTYAATSYMLDVNGTANIVGALTAASIAKTGGTSAQFLKADGSVDSSVYLTSSSLGAYLPLTGGTLTGALNGTSATFSGVVTATGNAATSSAAILNNENGASGTAQYYADFKAGATVIGRILRGNGAVGYESNGLNFDNYAGMLIKLNSLGGSGGGLTVVGGATTLGAALYGTSAVFSSTVQIGNNQVILTPTSMGYDSTYKVLAIGTGVSNTNVSLNYNPSGNAGAEFSGTGQIFIAHNKGILAPNAANTNYIAVLRPVGNGVYFGGGMSSGEVAGNGLFISTSGAGTFTSNVSASNFRVYNGSTTGGYFIHKAGWVGSGTDYAPSIAAETTYGINFFTNGSASLKMYLATTGQLQLNTYTSATSYSGTAAGYLAFDSSGNVITVAGVSSTDNTKLPLTGGALTGPLTITGNGSYLGDWGYKTLELNDTSGYAGIFFKNGANIWITRRNGADNAMDWAYSTNATAQGTGTFTQKMRLASDEWWVSTYPNYKMRVVGGDVLESLNGTSATTLYLQYHSNTGGNVNIAASKFIFYNTGEFSLGGGSGSSQSTLASGLTAIRFPNQYSSGYTDAGVKLYIFNSGTTIQGFTAGPAYDLQYHASGSDSGRHAFYVANTEIIRFNKTNISVTGIQYSTYNTATGRANLGFNVAKTVIGNYHIQNGGGPGNDNGNQAAITFQGSTASEAQAGIYVLNNGSYGTSMGFATTNSYATGPQLFMTATNGGVVDFPRAAPTVQGNVVIHAGNIGSYAISSSGGAISGDSYITFGPNSTWTSYLRVGGNGRTVSGDAYASVVTTNGNLHLDAGNSRAIYLNYYAGTTGVVFGTGASGVAASMDSAGNLWKGSTIGSGTQYWHAGNMDAPNKSGTSYYQVNTWLQMNGTHGIYWPSYNGAHIYANTDGSYGSIRIDGTRNGWKGIYFDSGNILMMNANESGHYQQATGWKWRWYAGQIYVSRGTNGGGTEYIVVDTGNISSYTSGNTNSISSATGNNYNWTGLNYFVSNRNTSTDSAPLQAYSNNGSGAIMSFHRGGYYAVNFGLDSDNVMRIGGWSAGVNRWQLDMSGNQTVAGNMTAGGALYSADWIYSNGNAGWYNNTYGQGLRQSKGNVSYGNVITAGESYNGWSGYNAQNTYVTCFMQNSSGTHGFYQEGGGDGWTAFYNFGNKCWGLGTDATDSSYSLHIIKYGGSNTGWIIWSDRRIKENIKTIDNALDKVLALRGVYYNKIDDPNKERCVGYIAQEVMEVVPELVVYSEELDMYNMNYAPMVGMITEAMKEQQAQIEELKQQVQTLLNS